MKNDSSENNVIIKGGKNSGVFLGIVNKLEFYKPVKFSILWTAQDVNATCRHKDMAVDIQRDWRILFRGIENWKLRGIEEYYSGGLKTEN